MTFCTHSYHGLNKKFYQRRFCPNVMNWCIVNKILVVWVDVHLFTIDYRLTFRHTHITFLYYTRDDKNRNLTSKVKVYPSTSCITSWYFNIKLSITFNTNIQYSTTYTNILYLSIVALVWSERARQIFDHSFYAVPVLLREHSA